MNERKQQIRADEWESIAADVRAGRVIAYYGNQHIIMIEKQYPPNAIVHYLTGHPERKDNYRHILTSDIIDLEWQDAALAGMATDPDIQREMAYIAAEFSSADMDGLLPYDDNNERYIASAGLLSEARASVRLDDTQSDPAADRIARLEAQFAAIDYVLDHNEISDITEAEDAMDGLRQGVKDMQAELDAERTKVAALEALQKVVEAFVEDYGDWSPKQRTIQVSSDAIKALMNALPNG